jgi:3-hydroxyacyl-CoA dehydrogenase / enoyl-CoA hydratase / 3-hydroxybutyryl-CoA epimerase / enoyl-CoA isomerase
MYSGQTMVLTDLGEGVVEWTFDTKEAPVNSLGAVALMEWEEVLAELESRKEIRGLLLSSAKPSFIAGANIKEFPDTFSGTAESVRVWATHVQTLCNRLESLPFPTVAAIDGVALGGGFELALSADRRVMSHSATVGLPEVTLGICPGWGGSVRLSRMLGLPSALPWLLEGKSLNAREALDCRVADLVTHSATLRTTALTSLKALADQGPQAWGTIRSRKRAPLTESPPIPDVFKQFVTAPGRLPAYTIFKAVQAHIYLPFDEALALEAEAFAMLAKGDDASALIGLFISEQRSKKIAARFASSGETVRSCAVIGAGLMGGGIAYQAAINDVSVSLRDVRQEALNVGLNAVEDLLTTSVNRGKISAVTSAKALARVHPTTGYQGFEDVSFAIEAVVERIDIKRAVLAEAEGNIRSQAVLATNTSTISVTDLAEGLKRPDRFCGMHFFNPPAVMPLVEIVRGEKSSDETIATAVRFALALGKKPIVVQDCPGFLVNRILFPYFNAFNRLLLEGISFERIDRAMEAFGWPMGPAHLADVIGLDTMVHADKVLQHAYPDRMKQAATVVVEQLLADGYLGKKQGEGFYVYVDGKRTVSTNALALLSPHTAKNDSTDAEIVERLMVPFCAEALRCLDEQIVVSADEVDLGAVLGLGFPRFRGGPLRYIEAIGLEAFALAMQRLSTISNLYVPPEGLVSRVASGEKIYK